MKMWYRHEGRSKASKLALEILEYVDEHLRGFEWRPRITSIGIRADCGDIYDFEVELEFSPGAFVVVRYGDCDDTERGGICTDSDAIGQAIFAVFEDFRNRGISALSAMLYDARHEALKTLSTWSGGATHAELVKPRLLRDEWCGRQEYLSDLEFRVLDNKLSPSEINIVADHPSLLNAKLKTHRELMDLRFARKTELARQGADGSIDQIAINAIAQRCDIADGIRWVANRTVEARHPDLYLYVRDGHIGCEGYDAQNSNFHWNGSSLTLWNCTLPEIAISQLAGQPITRLIEHPILSSDMIITEASSIEIGDQQAIQVNFDQPKRLFCKVSGRSW